MMRFLAFLLLIFSTVIFSNSPNSFAIAKKIASELFQDHPQTIYCKCSYQQKEVDLSSCNMESAQNKKRANRIEWEHIQAAEHFGRQFECWRTPLCTDKHGKRYRGRRCCQKIDEHYRHVESELYNLWPEVGLVNQARSNYRFGIVQRPKDYYGCGIALDKSLRRAEPPDYSKGIIARAYLFMSEHYNLSLSNSQRQLFEAWNRLYAPTEWERKWANQVAQIEGYDNPYITQWEFRSTI